MRGFLVRWSPVAGLVLASLGLGGCITNPMEELSAATNLVREDLLNQLTASDVAGGFAQFRDTIAGGVTSPSGLSTAQQVAIEALQKQLDAGESTQDEFLTSVTEILNDATPASSIAGLLLGSPFASSGSGDLTDLLGLAGGQEQQALSIKETLHAEIKGVRRLAKSQIRSLLSTQQQAILDQVSSSVIDQLGLPEDQQAGARLAIDLLASRLGLAPDQKTQIARIRDDLRLTVQQLHTIARDELLQVLSTDQLGLLTASN